MLPVSRAMLAPVAAARRSTVSAKTSPDRSGRCSVLHREHVCIEVGDPYLPSALELKELLRAIGVGGSNIFMSIWAM
jgi:hypothetical protein